MKKFLILAMSLMLALPASVCANEPAFSWQEALENAKKNTRRGITLKSYKVQGKIRNEARLEKLIDSWYSKDSYMVVNPIATDYDVYVRKINKIDNVGLNRTKEIITPHIKNIFSNSKNAITLVELCWEVNGCTVKTIAAVSDEHNFIFDKIGSYAIMDSDIRTTRHNETVQEQSKRSISLAGYAKNVFGIDAYNFDLNVSATFNEDGVLVDRSSRAASSQSAGWQCEADASVFDGEIDKSKYSRYKMSYNILGANSRGHNEEGTLR